MQRPYLHPLVRSIAAPGGRMMPSRSHGVERRTTELAETSADTTLWTAFLGLIEDRGQRGPLISSGPQRGNPHQHAQGTAYVTPVSGWNLSGVAGGWSFPAASNPSRPPTARLAVGRGWLPFGSNGANGAPLPSLPEPAQMVAPRLR